MAADCKQTKDLSCMKEKENKIDKNPTCNGEAEDMPGYVKDEQWKEEKNHKSGKENSSVMHTNCSDSQACTENKDQKVDDTSMNGEIDLDNDSVNTKEQKEPVKNDMGEKQAKSFSMETSHKETTKTSTAENNTDSVTSSKGNDSKVGESAGNQVNGEGAPKKDAPGKPDESSKENVESKKKVSKVTQVLKGAKAQTLNLRPIAQMLFDIGMDLTRQSVYRDLIKIQKKKDAMDKLETKEKEQLALLSESYDSLVKKNESFMIDTIHCSHCGYKTDSVNVMELHREHAHDQEISNFTCALCGSVTKVASAFLYHMEAVHKRKGRLILKHAFFVCPYCPYESNSRSTFQKHMDRCSKVFRESHNLVPLAPDCDIPLKQIKPPEKKQPKVAPKPVPPPKPVIREIPKPQPRPAIIPSTVQERNPMNKVTIKQVPPKTTIVARPPPPQPPPPPPPPPVQVPTVLPQQPAPAQNSSPLVQMNGQWYRLTTIGAQQFLLPAPAPSVSQMPVTRPQIIVQNQLSVPLAQGPSPPQKSGTFEVCEICGGFVKDRDSLRIHFYWAHKVDIHKDVFKAHQAPLKCPICQKLGKDVRFWTYQGLSRHRSNEHKDINVSGTDLKAEPNGLMKEIPKQCVVCAHVYQNTTTPQQYWSHMEMHGITSAKLFLLRKCLICGVAINEPKRLEKHLLTTHASLFDKNVLASRKPASAPVTSAKEVVKSPPKAKPLVVCDMCKISFQSEVVYQRHLDVVHTFKCTRCSQRLSSREVLMKHFHDSHGNEKDKCPVCFRLVKIGRSMVRHLKSEHVQACSVPLIRLRKSEVAKYMDERNQVNLKASQGVKRKTRSVDSADDIIMIDLDASPSSKVRKVEISQGSSSSAKKQILEVDGEEIVVEIQQDLDSNESEDDEKTKSSLSIVMNESKSDHNTSTSSCGNIDDKVKEGVEEAFVDCEVEEQDKDAEKNDPGEQIEISDGEEGEEEEKQVAEKGAGSGEQEVVCEDISSEEDEESEEEAQDAESINISSDDEVMETD